MRVAEMQIQRRTRTQRPAEVLVMTNVSEEVSKHESPIGNQSPAEIPKTATYTKCMRGD